MYCPRCGEEQTSGNLRFCNRCGMPMELVSEVTANGGTLPILEETLKKKKILTRKNGVIFSLLWFVFWVPFGAAFWGVLDVDEFSEMSAVFGVFSSIMIFLCSIFFLGKQVETPYSPQNLQQQNTAPQNLAGQQPNQSALPPQQSQPAQDFVSPSAGSWKAPDTGELAQPGSVTEGTTRLLQKEENE